MGTHVAALGVLALGLCGWKEEWVLPASSLPGREKEGCALGVGGERGGGSSPGTRAQPPGV